MRGRGRKGLVEGRVQHKGRFAFLLSEEPGQPDVYLGGPSVRLAMNGDRVQARVRDDRGRRTGEIVRVLERAKRVVVGALRRAGGRWALVPEDMGIDGALEVLGFAPGLSPEEGRLAVLRVERWPDERRPAAGTIVQDVGAPDEPAARVRAVLAARDIPEEFPDAALAEAAALPADPAPEDWRGRRELFDLPVCTIDGADAKDFDDAVSLETLPGGRRLLGVHIAAVADHVPEGSALDEEAVRRGTSVYLPGRVIPMLPPALSDRLCSLVPDRPRLTLTCWIELDPKGRPLKARHEETVIRSARRFTYDEVQELLDGKPVERVPPALAEAVRGMGALAKQLTALRMGRGALDVSVPEYQVDVGPDGEPVAVRKRPRLDSHRLIEELMLAANEATARALEAARLPFLRRVHEDPDPARLQELQEELGKLGLRASTSLVAHPVKGLQSLLAAAKGHPFEETAGIQIIRSMRLARYAAEPGGHFGLAAKDYCHYTSPIRRYPDLQVHRAVKRLLAGERGGGPGGLESLALRCSERERAAQEAERRAVDLARARLMGRRVGEEFEGVVVNATAAGAFVALPESGAVGLWRGGGAPVGQRLKVKLVAVDLALGRLEFEPVRSALPGQVRLGAWKKRPGR